ncbi:(S)-2-hydroxy-acid oxidase [Frankia canadensis]|uniref:(S)-2-hydroxy-acid oxidase n=1 Tax=Frankia canadensis TaxID=1836972 RepID=A0A2I2KIL2_9ACTN|nr:alpha-hydroxy acid oxidase [Frankia canadensis]SNQ45501.1 (S)-2-hydroxy-acid oxidase [Frankia canadensis]SOU52791.1 (S)-2-hydroxy-acid oxidase [Frankia canadensis]
METFVSFASAGTFATVGEIYDAARAALPPEIWDFLDGGAGGEQTLRANRAAFDRWTLRPRLMTGVAEPDLSTTFLGIALSMPVLTSPFGADRLLHPEGHLAVARANAKAGVASMVPEAGSFSWEEVTTAAPAAARIAQLHPMGNVANFTAMLDRAADVGFAALCLTLDCPSAGWRERNMRNRFDVDVETVSGNYPHATAEDLADTLGQLFIRHEPVWTWDELAERTSSSPLPWIAKGVLTGPDAVRAVRAGAAAVLVSNHGGRQLDAVPAALEALPEVVAAVGGTVPIALDSGIRRGSDVVKALALGADVVVLGRAAAMALAAGGEEALARLHELLREEISTTIKLLGAASVAYLDPSMITPAPRVTPW